MAKPTGPLTLVDIAMSTPSAIFILALYFLYEDLRALRLLIHDIFNFCICLVYNSANFLIQINQNTKVHFFVAFFSFLSTCIVPLLSAQIRVVIIFLSSILYFLLYKPGMFFIA